MLGVMAAGYGQSCPVARALEVVGEKWSLLIVRDLLRKGPLRFQDFERGLSGIAPNILSARLKSLEQWGVLSARLYQQHPPRLEYSLTQAGRELGPLLLALRKWGEKHRKD